MAIIGALIGIAACLLAFALWPSEHGGQPRCTECGADLDEHLVCDLCGAHRPW